MHTILTILSILFLSFQVEAVRNCSCVAFRVENIQDYYEVASQKAILDTFVSTNSSVTAAVIANFFGADVDITSYIQNLAGQQNCFRTEIANNGFYFENFALLNDSEQVNQLQMSQNALNTRFGYLPKTFVPPFDSINQQVKTSLKTVGIKTLSADENIDPPPYETNSTDLWRWPVFPSFGKTISGNNVSTPVSTDQVFTDIHTQFSAYGFSVIRIEPRTFGLGGETISTGVNQTAITELRNLILRIKESGLRLVTLDEIQDYFNASKVHPCDHVTPSTTGSMTSGDMTTGHMTSGEMTSASMTTSESTSGSITSGHVTSGRLTTGVRAITSGAMTSGEEIEAATTEAFIRGESSGKKLSNYFIFTLLLLLL